MFIPHLLVLVLALIAVLLVSLFINKSCVKANLISIGFLVLLCTAVNWLYTAYLNLHAKDQRRNEAVATAICPNATPQEYRCTAITEPSGYQVHVVSASVLDERVVLGIVAHAKRIKPAITNKRIVIDFEQKRVASTQNKIDEQGRNVTTTAYAYDVYKRVNI